MIHLPEDGNELVHDAAPCSYKFMLGALAQLGQFQWVCIALRSAQKSERSRDLKRCGRTQPRSYRDLSLDDQVCPANRITRLQQQCCYATHKIRPMPSRRARQIL